MKSLLFPISTPCFHANGGSFLSFFSSCSSYLSFFLSFLLSSFLSFLLPCLTGLRQGVIFRALFLSTFFPPAIFFLGFSFCSNFLCFLFLLFSHSRLMFCFLSPRAASIRIGSLFFCIFVFFLLNPLYFVPLVISSSS